MIKMLLDSTYKTELADTKTVVKFYADWCGSCRLFAPKFKKMAEDEQFSSFQFGESNAEENPEFRKFAEVNNLPYFAVFENGEFKGGLSTAKPEALAEFVTETLGV
jgi:thiol-disulfide isomerase/thioredoxin